MGQTYTVQVLNDKEFDSLPYEGISDSLGFADVKKGLAFVRNTGNKEFDLATVSHEINHLIEKHGKEHPDWENGILHKKGGALRQIVPALLAFVPGIGPALSAVSAVGMDQYAKSNHPEQLGKPGNPLDIALTGALAYGGAKLGQGTPGFQAGVDGSKAAGGGLLGQTLSGAKGLLVGTPATGTAASTSGLLGKGGSVLGLGTAPSPAIPSGTSALVSSIPSAGTAAANAAATGAGTTFSSVPQAGMGLLGQVGSFNAVNSASKAATAISPSAAPAMSLNNSGVGTVTGAPATPPQTPLLGNSTNLGSAITPTANASAPAASKAFAFKDLITPTNVLGGASLLGSMGQQTPQFEMPDSVEQLRSKLTQGEGLSPLGMQAQAELSNILKSTPQELYAPANDAYYAETNRVIDQQYEQAKKQLDAAYNNAGMLGSGEYFAELNKLTQAQASAKSAFAQTENQRRMELARTDKYRAIQDSLGVDKNTMDNLVGLTGLDVQTAAMIYGAKAADVEAIRKALGTLGTEMILRGQGMTSNPGITLQLGK